MERTKKLEDSVARLTEEVNQRKQAEAKLRESYAILQAIMEFLPEGLTIADAPDVNIRTFGKVTTGFSDS